MHAPWKRTRTLAALILIAAGCGRPSAAPEGRATPMTPQLAADLSVARQARIFFYHHSVGENLLAGLSELDALAGGPRLRLASPREAASVDGPVLAHGEGGQNKVPKSKIDFFAATLRGEPRLRPDLALMKFCYVDFHPKTDVDELFAYYRSTLEGLQREFPDVRFAHVTVPLTDRPSDAKSTLRRALGLEVWADAANARRAEFSRRLKEAFPGDPIFDLAEVEATAPDGSTTTFELGGRRYPSLQPRYTDDGGHLNAEGKRVAAEAAVRFVARALRAERAAR